MKLRLPAVTGPAYRYLGHFRQDQYLRRGHNDLPEPAATQEALGFSRPHRRERAAERRDLRRVVGTEAKQFRKANPGADIHDYDRFQRWKQANPDVPVKDLIEEYRHVDWDSEEQ